MLLTQMSFNMTKHTILIIDDDKLIINTLQQRLSTWQTDIYTASGPQEAKKILETVTPEVILLDLLLTEADGSEGILDFIKSRPALTNASVLVLTNLEKPELKKMLLAQGVKEYLIKGSLSLDELYEKVLGYLEPTK